MSDVDIVDSKDYDDDGNYSDFNLNVSADTRIAETYGVGEGEPYFQVRINGEPIYNTTIVDRRNGSFNITIPRKKINNSLNEPVPAEVSVILFDEDTGTSDDKRGRMSSYTFVEPVPKERVAIESVFSFSGAYRKFSHERLNVDYHEDRQLETFEYSLEALLPLTEEDVAEGLLTETVDASTGLNTGLASDLLTITEVSGNTYLTLRHSKRASLLREATRQDEGDYNNFNQSLSALEGNTQDIQNASLENKRDEYLQERLDLLEKAYRSVQEFNNNVKAAVGALRNDYFPDLIESLYQGDENTYKTVEAEFQQLETQLAADYVYTQLSLEQTAVRNLSAEAGYTQSEYPDPYVDVQVPDSVTAGEPATVTLTVENRGGRAALQTGAVSFPGIKDTSQVRIVNNSLADPVYSDAFGPGESLGYRYGAGGSTTASYVLAETGGETNASSTFTVEVEVTPREDGKLEVYAKSVARNGGWYSYPSRTASGRNTDQQDEYVISKQINVTENQTESEPNVSDISIETGPGTDVSDTFEATDPDGDSLSYDLDTAPDHGSVSISGDSFVYTPNPGYTGLDSFTYRVSDGTLAATGTVSVDVDTIDTIPPQANAGADRTVTAGKTVALDGSDSTDNVGITAYEWDIDNDGTYERFGSSTTYSFQNSGAKIITLRVTDTDGNVDTDIVNISVLETISLPTDAGDTFETATKIGKGIYSNLTVGGLDDDTDYYEVDVTSGEQLATAIRYDDTNEDPTIKIYNDDGILLGENPTTTGYGSVGAAGNGSEAPYYIEVYDTDSVEYDLQVVTGENAVASFSDKLEPNDEFSRATTIPDGVYRNLTVGGLDDDTDYYAVNVTDGEQLATAIRYNDTNEDPTIKIYDDDGSLLGENPTTTGYGSVGAVGNGSEAPYYIEVYDTDSVEYDLQVETGKNAVASFNDKLEPNDEFSTATMLTEGTYSNLTVGGLDDDTDYYQVSVTDGEQLAAAIRYNDTNEDPTVKIYDDDGSLLGENPTTTGYGSVGAAGNVSEAPYYIEVYDTDSVEYDLQVETGKNAVASFNDKLEPNDEFSTATAIPDGVYRNLTVGGLDDDTDYYAVNVTDGEQLAAAIRYDDTSEDPTIEIYNSEGVLLAENPTTTGYGSLGAVGNGSEAPYYVEVSDTDSVEYDLQVVTGENAVASFNDKLEPNGEFSTATMIADGIYSNQTVGGPDDDTDYYEVDVTDSEQLAAAIRYSDTSEDPTIRIYDDHGTLLAENPTTTGYGSVGAVGNGSEAPYYVEVSDTDSVEYDLQVETGKNATATFSDKLEPNDEFSTATTIPDGVYRNLTVGGLDDDTDYYEVDVTSGEQLAVAIRYDDTNEDPTVNIYNHDGTLLAENPTTTGYGSVGAAGNASKAPYYIEVYDTDSVEYDLQVETGENAVASFSDKLEPNDEFSTATTIPDGVYPNLTVGGRDDDTDYYAVHVADGEQLAAAIQYDDTSGDPTIKIYDNDGTEIASNSTTTGYGSVGVVSQASGSPYYIEVSDTSDVEYNLQVETNTPPAASFSYTPLSPTTGEQIAFDATGSYDPDGSIASYKWDIDSDGTVDVSGSEPTYSYDTTGNYTVTLTVTDNTGATATTTRTVSVLNRPPTADAGGSYSVTEGGSVTLDASESTDSDGSIVSQSWEIISGPGSLSSGSYQAPDLLSSDKEATVELTVVDNDGATDTDQTTINIIEQNTAPVAEAGGPYSVNEGQTINLNSSGSKDRDGSISNQSWQIVDGNGSISGETYAAPDSISTDETTTVELTVIDDDGATAIDQAKVSINDSEGNPPTSAFSYSPATPTAGESISFNQNASDPDRDIEVYSWNFGDGSSSTQANPRHTYNSSGSYNVTLTVTDKTGNTDANTSEILVSENKSSPTATDVSVVTNMNTSVSGVFNASNSDSERLSYSIASRPSDGVVSVSGKNFTYTPDSGYFGTDSFTYTVTDDNGDTATATVNVTVESKTIAVRASTEENISVGGNTTLSIFAQRVNQITVTKLWSDWTLTATSSDGTVSDRIAGAGEIEIQYSSINQSASPSITISLPDRYIGGEYAIEISATNMNGEKDQTIVAFRIN